MANEAKLLTREELERMRGALDYTGHCADCEALLAHADAAEGVMRDALRLAVRPHYYCEDSWYSCPKAEGGCANDACGEECNCGADEHNTKVAKLTRAIGEEG